MENTILQEILKDSVWIGVILFGCYKIIQWLSKKYEKAEEDKSELARDVLRLTLSIEAKMTEDKFSDEEIKRMLTDIRNKIYEMEKKWVFGTLKKTPSSKRRLKK